VFCTVVCIAVSLMTPRPAPERVSDAMVFNWRTLNIFKDLGDRWYTSVLTWWLLFAALVAALMLYFSGLTFQ